MARRGLAAATAGIVALPLMALPATAAPVPAPATSASAASASAAVMSGTSGTSAPSGRLVRLVALAKRLTTQHIPYVYGGGHGRRPGATGGGYDCSGLVRFLYYRSFDVDLGSGSANSLLHSGRFVRTAHPVPGDLVFFGGRSYAHHVGVYIGHRNGRPRMVNAPQSGFNVQTDGAGGAMGYWHYRGASPADSITASSTATHIRVSDHDVTPGRRSIVTSWATANGRRISGVRLYLYQRSPGGRWKLGNSAITNASGKVHFAIYGGRSAHDYQVRLRASGEYRASSSPAIHQTVHFRVSGIRDLRSSMRSGGVGAIHGRTSSALAGQVVRVQRITRDGWVATGGATVVGRTGAFAIHFRMRVDGVTYYRLKVRPTLHTGASVGAPRAVHLHER